MTRFVERAQVNPPDQGGAPDRADAKTRAESGTVRNPAWDRARDLGSPGRWYALSREEVRVLHDVAAFRVVAKDDLRKFACGGDEKALERVIARLEENGLLQSRRLYSHETHSHLELVTVRRRGARLLTNAQEQGDEQAFFHGFVKPREAVHDSGIYRMFQMEAEQIAARGSRVSRVVLDFELKRELFRRIAARKEGWHESDSEARKVVAERLELPIVNERIQLPDLRIEYVDGVGTRAHVDLELATHHYKQSQLAAKARAGFRIYTSGGGGVPQDERVLRLFEI